MCAAVVFQYVCCCCVSICVLLFNARNLKGENTGQNHNTTNTPTITAKFEIDENVEKCGGVN
jgi:hypothetical protein